MRFRRLATAVAVAVAAAMTLGLIPNTVPSALPTADADDLRPHPRAGDCLLDGAVTTGAIFNNPHTGAADRIHAHVGCLIDGAPADAKINIAGYHFADAGIAEAVQDAIRRGVRVRVLLDGAVPANGDDGPFVEDVQQVIDDHPGTGSWIRTCPGSGDDRACIADRRMHNKLITLSETHGAGDVTFLTTSNFEDVDNDGKGNSGTDMWNSGYTAANDPALHTWFADRYFADLADPEAENLDYYEEAGLPRKIGDYRVHHSPRASGNTALEVLDRVECHDNHSGGTEPGHRTIVRLAMWSITDTGGVGTAIAKRLWQLDNDGCYVDIVADEIGYDEDDPSNHGSLRTLLAKPERTSAGGAVNYHGPEVREFNGGERNGLHQKNLMIDGRFDGKPDQKVVFTGSYNFTQPSAGDSDRHPVNDETWLEIHDPGVHDRFVDNFFTVRNAAHTCWQTSKPAACDGGREIDSDPQGELNCHQTADKYSTAGRLYLYAGTYCDGPNDAWTDGGADGDHGDGKGQIKGFDNRTDSIVNTTDRHIEFYNYPRYNESRPDGDRFCLRPGSWINRVSKYGDGAASWSNSISSHRPVDPADCDRWLGGFHVPNR